MRRSRQQTTDSPILSWKLITADSHDQKAPSPRQGHTSTSFPRRNFFIIFGGKCSIAQLTKSSLYSNIPTSTSHSTNDTSTKGVRDGKTFFYNDCYRFDCKTKTWSPLLCTGNLPSPRAHHTSVSMDNTRLVVMGGTNGRGRLNDVYRLNIGTLVWDCVDVSNTSLSSHQIHSASTFQNHPDKIFIFGISTERRTSSNHHDTNHNHTTTLINVSLNIATIDVNASIPLGDVPPSRSHYSAVTYNNSVILFGGFDGTIRYNDVRMFNPSTNVWTLIHTIGDVPEGRYKHDACVFGDYMIVMGGYSVQWLNDVLYFNLKTYTWTKINNILHSQLMQTGVKQTRETMDEGGSGGGMIDGVVPRPRESHTVTLIGSFVYILGGWSWPNSMNDMYRFRAGRVIRKLMTKMKNVTAPAVVRKVPSKGSVLITELDSPGGTTGGLSSLMVTGRRNKKSNDQTKRKEPEPLFSLKNKAFRSSHDRRQMHENNNSLRRSNSNLLVARKTSSPLPNIRQLAHDSDDSDDSDGDMEDGTGGGGKKYHIQRSTSSKVENDQHHHHVPISPPPVRSSLSPVTKAASSRRREYMRMKSNGRSTNSNNKSLLLKKSHSGSNFNMNEEEKRTMNKEINRRVEAAISIQQHHIAEQEQRKVKAEHGLKALSDMLNQLDQETSQLKINIKRAEDEKMKLGPDGGKKAFQQAYNMEIETKNKMDDTIRQVKTSQERINDLQDKLTEQLEQKIRITEMSKHINEQISDLKKKIQRDDEHRKLENDDGVNSNIQHLTQVADDQGDIRRKLTQELNLLKENQQHLKLQIEEQLREYKNVTKEEDELREKVESLVLHLAGPSEATEAKPYERMSASMFGDSMKNDLGGMLISR